jgi:hypothetical protein
VLTSARTADAKYVHFFLEKIPSRAMEQYTPLEPLDELISSTATEHQAPPLRTRALVQIFKREWEGAILDLTQALRITEGVRLSHKPDQQQLELASRMRDEQEAWNSLKMKTSLVVWKSNYCSTELECIWHLLVKVCMSHWTA